MMPKPKVFISYSHKDESWKDRLVGHLSVLEREMSIRKMIQTHKEGGLRESL